MTNQLGKELNFWVETSKQNTERMELKIKSIIEEIVTPLINQNRNLELKIDSLTQKIKEQEQTINDSKIQCKNEIKLCKIEMDSNLDDIKIDQTKIKKENEDLFQEQMKMNQKLHDMRKKYPTVSRKITEKRRNCNQ